MPVNPQVQDRNATNAGAATSHALAYSSDVTAGTTLLAFIRIPSNSVTVTSITDTLGNPNWTLVRRQAHGTAANSGELWKCENSLGGANTVTFNYSGSVATQLWIAEYNGSQTLVEDQKDGANNDSTTNGGGTINTVHPDSVVIFCLAFATGFSISAGPVSYNRQDDTLSNRIAVYTRIVSTTLSSEAPTATTAAVEASCGIVANFGYTAASSTLLKTMQHHGLAL